MSLMFTFTGERIDPLQPHPDQIHVRDVAYHLAGLYRYGGATRLTVAQHCCELAWYALHSTLVAEQDRQRLAYDLLLHDAPEYLLGDVIAPIKYHSSIGDGYRRAEHGLQTLLKSIFRYGAEDRLWHLAGKLDRLVRAVEVRDLMPWAQTEVPEEHHSANEETTAGSFDFGCEMRAFLHLQPWNHARAERRWLELYRNLRPAGAPSSAWPDRLRRVHQQEVAA